MPPGTTSENGNGGMAHHLDSRRFNIDLRSLSRSMMVDLNNGPLASMDSNREGGGVDNINNNETMSTKEANDQ